MKISKIKIKAIFACILTTIFATLTFFACSQNSSHDTAEIKQPALKEKPSALHTENPSILPDGMVRVSAGSLEVECAKDFECYQQNRPTRTLTVDNYLIDITEVTNAQYRLCVQAGICTLPIPDNWYQEKPSNHPVVSVNWLQANRYCSWRQKRLPTNPEWEFVARDGQTGNSHKYLSKVAWHRHNTEWEINQNPSEFYFQGETTHPVSTKMPNSKGIYDLLGNVWEWNSNRLREGEFSKLGLVHGEDDLPGSYYQLSGGSWYSEKSYLDFSFRTAILRDQSSVTIGFRCAADAPPTADPGPSEDILTQQSSKSPQDDQ